MVRKPQQNLLETEMKVQFTITLDLDDDDYEGDDEDVKEILSEEMASGMIFVDSEEITVDILERNKPEESE